MRQGIWQHLQAVWLGRVPVELGVKLLVGAPAADLHLHGRVPLLHQPVPPVLVL